MVQWEGDTEGMGGEEWMECVEDADVVVNLCGKPIVSRWNEEGKKKLVSSRISCTRKLVKQFEKSLKGGSGGSGSGGSGSGSGSERRRKKVFVSTSAVGYYGTSEKSEFDESSEKGRDFLADLCQQWEDSVLQESSSGADVRKVILRFGVVLGKDGGALAQMLPAFKFFLGGPVMPGTQWVSWIHVDDLVKAIRTVIEDEKYQGVYNATAPNPVTMNEMSSSLGKALKRPNLFPVPSFVLQLLYGQGSQVVTEGQRVLPKRFKDQGFKFDYETIDDAMRAIAKQV